LPVECRLSARTTATPACQWLIALSPGRLGGGSSGRRKVGVPQDIAFATKPEIALEQLRWACAAGLPRGVVLLDAAYGNNSELRTEITALDLSYVAGILSTTTYGRQARRRCRRSGGRAMDGQRRGCAVMPDTSRSQSRNWRLASPSAPLAHNRMARRLGRATGPRALRVCACVSRIRDDQRAIHAAGMVAD